MSPIHMLPTAHLRFAVVTTIIGTPLAGFTVASFDGVPSVWPWTMSAILLATQICNVIRIRAHSPDPSLSQRICRAMPADVLIAIGFAYICISSTGTGFVPGIVLWLPSWFVSARLHDPQPRN